jgi:endonuclease/exonuclease/phosphatase (EEP) superfamily protein YafD
MNTEHTKSGRKSVLSAIGMMQVSTMLLGLATVLGFFGSFWWLFDLAAHFRFQYLGALLLLFVVSLILRRRKLALLCAVFGLINAAVILPLWQPDKSAIPSAGQRLRVLTFNVHTANGNKTGVLEVIRAAKADVVALQEVDGEWMDALKLLRAEFPFIVEEPREDNFGICVFSRLPITGSNVFHWGGAEVPSISCQVRVEDQTVTVIATHPLPPVGRERSVFRDEQLGLLARHVAGLSGPVIVMGDLNTTPWGVSFRGLLAESGLRDSSRGHGWQPTWPAFMQLLFIPLDHVLVSPNIAVISRSVGKNAGSDHRPVMADLLVPGRTTPAEHSPATGQASTNR